MRCEHGWERCSCKDCGGCGICQHGQECSQCNECRAHVIICERPTAATTIARPIDTTSKDAAAIFTLVAEADILCFCGIDRHLPTNDLPFNGVWVECNSCPRWSHGECAGLDLGFGRGMTKVEADAIDYECRVCKTGPPVPPEQGWFERNPLCLRGLGEIETATAFAEAPILPSEDEDSDGCDESDLNGDELQVVPIVGGGVMMVPKRCTKLEANSLTKPVAKKHKRDEGATPPRSEHEARTAKVLKEVRWMVPGERPRGRWMVSTEQLARLEAIFDEQNLPCASVRGSLAAEFGVGSKQVSCWFRNRRFRSKGHQ